MWKLCNLIYFPVGTSLYHVFFPSFTGYLEQGLMVKDPQKLRKNYFNSKYVIFDVLSILPTGYSLSEALILALTYQKYDNRLVVELRACTRKRQFQYIPDKQKLQAQLANKSVITNARTTSKPINSPIIDL